MFTVTIDRPTDWPNARIHILSDLHIGDAHSDMRTIEARIDAIKNDPRALVVLNGDIMNTATKSSMSDIYSETLKPMEAINRAVQLFTPIKGQIIGADTGNHESRVYQQDGIDIMRLVCRELGVERVYNPEGVLIFLRSISEATCTISSNEGVISPLRPIKSTFSLIAVSMIFSAGTITPRSITL